MCNLEMWVLTLKHLFDKTKTNKCLLCVYTTTYLVDSVHVFDNQMDQDKIVWRYHHGYSGVS